MSKQSLAAIAACLLLLASLVQILAARGGPYFDRPATVVEHVFPERHEARDALLALPLARRLLPRGATVVCFYPIKGKWRLDVPNLHTAVAELPDQFIVPAYAASEDIPKSNLATYVLAIDGEFTHPGYRVIAEFPTGRLYQVIP